MPAHFDDFGLAFLYPDNWTIAARAEDEGGDGVTFELPSGGFFSIETVHEDRSDDELIQRVADAIIQEYGEAEREELAAPEGQRKVDFRFYYLDLVIISRALILSLGANTYLLQMQAESRDFDNNELVFEAIVKQLCPA